MATNQIDTDKVATNGIDTDKVEHTVKTRNPKTQRTRITNERHIHAKRHTEAQHKKHTKRHRGSDVDMQKRPQMEGKPIKIDI